MPKQILPITGVDQIGLISPVDQPPMTIPPNALTEVGNVRFRDGAIMKMEGEVNIFPDIDTDTEAVMKYIAWWPNPNQVASYSGYYLMIIQKFDSEADTLLDYVYIVNPQGDKSLKGKFTRTTVGNWQHTFFQGGFCIIINNGIDVPHYILDEEGNTDIDAVPDLKQLPGWESYNVNQVLLDDVFQSGNSRTFDLGKTVNFVMEEIVVTEVTNASTETDLTPVAGVPAGTGTPNDTNFVPGNLPTDIPNPASGYAIYNDTETGTTVIQLSDSEIELGDRVRVTIRSRDAVNVRCGVIRSFGDFLVAGNLREVPESDPDAPPIRSLPGVVRTSDAAAPGSIPNNWNPFAAGVSTADEFVVTQEGVVQDMAELQGALYMYSNNSISVMRQTGNPAVPLTVTSVTDSYGCQTTNALLQFDGQHVVVGSQDIYIFGGHPGNIQSISDGRVRRYFYDSLNPLHEQRMFLMRHQSKDEIWLCYPTTSSVTGECDRALIWNYRKNNWTERDLHNVMAGDVGPIPGGGIPSRQVNLSGISGDNGVVDIGAREVQGIMIKPDQVIFGDTDGRLSEYTITVNPGVVGFETEGRPIFDFQLHPDFNSGMDSPAWVFFTGYDSEGTVTFTVQIQLPPNVTTRDQFVAALEADDEFNMYINIITTNDNDREVVFEVLDDDTVSTTVSIGSRLNWDDASLADFRNDAFDSPANADLVFIDTETVSGTEREIHRAGFYISPEQVGKWYLIDVPNLDVNDPANDFEWRVMRGLGGVNLYGGDGQMYLSGRTGTAERPYKLSTQERAGGLTPFNASDSQYMYKDRDLDNDTEQVTPYVPSYSGWHYIEYSTPSAGVPAPGLATLIAHDPPPTEHDGANLGLQLLDITRESFDPTEFIDPEVIMNAPPVLGFTNGYRFYESDRDNPFLSDYDTDYGGWLPDPEREVYVYTALGGDLTTPNRASDMAEFIAHAFQDDPNSIFFAVDNANVVDIEGREFGITYLLFEQFFPNSATGLLMSDFTVDVVDPGLYPIQTGNGVLVGKMEQPLIPIEYPQIQLFTGTETFGASSARVYNFEHPNPDTDLRTGEIVQQIAEQYSLFNAWSGDSEELPNRYVQPTGDTDTYRLITAVEHDDLPYRREIIDSIAVRILSYGTSAVRASGDWKPDFKSTRDTEDGTAYGVTIDSEVDFRGSRVWYATPTYVGILIYNSEATNNLETLVLQAGDRGDYNIETQEGTNGERLNNESVSEKWQAEIALANRRLAAIDRGTNGNFILQPTNYDDTANFVLEFIINDTPENARRIQNMASGSVEFRGEVMETTVNSRSLTIEDLFFNYDEDIISVATNSLDSVVDTNDSQFNPSDTRVPNRDRYDSEATLEDTYVVTDLDEVFDVDRPWPRTEVNFNKEFPIFAQNTALDDNYQINKIAGGDIGWQIPQFSRTPRTYVVFQNTLWIGADTDANGDVILGDDGLPIQDTDSNDYPRGYRSFINRQQFPISPEFSVENISGIALWADGTYIPRFLEDEIYGKLIVSTFATDNPGQLYYFGIEPTTTNEFYITENYKVDMRVTGRFMNMFIGDNFEDYPRPEERTIDGKTFSQNVGWRVAGMQIEIMQGGSR